MILELETRGFDEAVDWLGGIDVPKRLGIAVENVVVYLARYAATLTPVVTGAMRSAWRGRDGRVYIDPSAVNPQSGARVTDYAESVSNRLGIMDAVVTAAGRTGVAELELAFDGI